MPRPSEESPYRLLVEGPDDQFSVIHLMARHGFDWNDEASIRPLISSEGGIDKLLAATSVSLKGTYVRLGIILDANSDPAHRWAQVRDRARRADLNLPDSPQPEGTIIHGHRPGSRIGFWLMPDNKSLGALEHFLGSLVPSGHPIWIYADEVTTQARKRGASCKEKDHAKSVLHTWLAWQDEPGLPFGIALKAGFFETDNENALRFVSWFNRLFVDT
ncbi:MAG TPA: DUF3226 domain-containing protein [Thermoanaerobaculia bacterium]|jgi:hypothetical protein|nr:DUF3226 domain-containing protein [Thermoanaerobaculia bacterium]